MGTTIDIRLVGPIPPLLRVARFLALRTIAEQSKLFDLFDSSSAISFAQRSGAIQEPKLQWLLDEALRWKAVSDGAFDPYSTGSLNLNGIAKGYIVDQACGSAARLAASVVISGGGDVRHQGGGSIVVGIEHPHQPYDNRTPFRRARISNQGLATSGTARRGRHIIDPRSNSPVDHISSASVIADTAMTADALATALTVLSVQAGISLIAATPGTACLIVEKTGAVHQHRWPE